MPHSSLPIALDAMGGDKSPHAVIHGAAIALKTYPDLTFRFYGDQEVIAPLIRKYKVLRDISTIIHTDEMVEMHEKPSVALRKLKKNSMRLAINAVQEGDASAMVSAGNTGALMATAKFVLKTLEGIDRPAITATMPAKGRDVVVLDMGANVDCTPENLQQFAIMGDAYAKALLGTKTPYVGLLNVGSEEMKGHGLVQDAHQLLKENSGPVKYVGFVEGNDILEGKVDVVVTDGFTGNVVLKTAEGAARLLYDSLKDAINHSWMAKIGLLMARPAMKRALKRYDPRANNGAILLGLNGIAVKSHGGTDAKGFANAIRVAVKLSREKINDKIIEELTQTSKTASQSTKVVELVNT